MAEELDDDHALALELAREAGRMLLVLQATSGLGGAALGAEGDRIANDYLMGMLRLRRGHDATLSEEEQDGPDRLSCRRVWIVDPLDGTREFSEGRDDWAVHVALAQDGEAVAGAVALPARNLCFGTHMAQHATEWTPHAPRILISRSRACDEAQHIADVLGGSISLMGSAGAKAMAIIRGDADIYINSGGLNEWDAAAPIAVARAFGLHASRIDGSPIRFNQRTPFIPDLLICHPAMARPVMAAVNPA